MTYDLSNELDRSRAALRMVRLSEKGALIELTEKAIRSPNQNKYAHLLMGVVAMEVGERLEYVKEVYFKKLVNSDIFCIRKQDAFVGEVVTIRSLTDLSQEEISLAIDRFKRWGTEQGWHMPDPEDESIIRALEIEIERHRQFL